MFDLEQLIDFDKHLLLMMNGSGSLFFDGVMHVYTTTVVWIFFSAGSFFASFAGEASILGMPVISE